MNTKAPHITLVTNGAPDSLPAVDYGIWLAGVLKTNASLLGLQEHGRWETQLPAALSYAQTQLESLGIRHQVVHWQGNAETLLQTQASNGNNLFVFGPLGRSGLLRWVRGRSLRRILLRLQAPCIYVRQAPHKLRHILVCIGGLGYSLPVLESAILLAEIAKASITLMHIIEPGGYQYPTVDRMRTHATDFLHSHTPQADNLAYAVQAAKERQLETHTIIRQGHVLAEIYTAASSGEYDLIGLGSHYRGQGMRSLASANITVQVAERIDLPVLIAGGLAGET